MFNKKTEQHNSADQKKSSVPPPPSELGQKKETPAKTAPPPPSVEPDIDKPTGWLPTEIKLSASATAESWRRDSIGPQDCPLDLPSSRPRDKITGMNWEEATAFRRSESGSGGVFFIGFEDGVVVVKGSMTIAQELFATKFAERIGVKAPKIRAITYTDPEWAQMKECLLRLSARHEADKQSVEKSLNRAFVMVEEFVYGVDFEKLDAEIAAAMFGDRLTKRMTEVGLILAMDAAVNNWDRLPALWDNDLGNLQNLIVSERFDFKEDGTKTSRGFEVVAIDQGFTAINTEVAQDGLIKYQDKVKAYIQKLVSKPNEVAEETIKIRDAMKTFSGYEIKEEGLLAIQSGFIEGIKTICTISSEELAKMKENIVKLVEVDWADVWADGCKLINLEFVQGMIDLFRENLKSGSSSSETDKQDK